MKVVSLDVDSGERDPVAYPNPNDYTVRLNKRLYGVTKMTLTAARIPNCQPLVNSANDTIVVDGVAYHVAHGTFSGPDLASNVQVALEGSNVSAVSFSSALGSLTLSNASSSTFVLTNPPTFLGLSGANTAATTTLTTGPVDLTGPNSVLVRSTVGSDDLNKDIVNGSMVPNYIGRIVLGNLGETHVYNMVDAPITYEVPTLNVDEFRVRMYWNNGTTLVPYDFGARNHLLKFDFTCETDRFNKVYEAPTEIELPEPVPDVDDEPPRLSNNWIFLGTALVLVIGLLVLLFIRGPPLKVSPGTSS